MDILPSRLRRRIIPHPQIARTFHSPPAPFASPQSPGIAFPRPLIYKHHHHAFTSNAIPLAFRRHAMEHCPCRRPPLRRLRLSPRHGRSRPDVLVPPSTLTSARNGNSPAQSEDLVQGFFLRILEKDALASVDRSRGKFRSFLLASLKNFLANEYDKAHAQKRGGTKDLLSLDALDAESRYAAEPADQMTPDRVFERRWALAVLDLVLARLREEYTRRNQQALFAPP